MKRVGVLVSGQGSNLRRLIETVRAGDIREAEIALVAADRPCAALEIATSAGIAVFSEPAKSIGMEAWQQRCLSALHEARVECLVLAGFMRILDAAFIQRFEGRILNVHPSLLPAFPGRDAIGQAVRHGVRVSGVTVHLVDETLDGGPIVLQEAVPVHPDDDAERLGARLHMVEHRILPEALRLLCADRIRIEGRRTTII